MKLCKRKYNSHSKFDPYLETISELLDSGCTIREIAEIIEQNMNDIVDENALYAFVRKHELRSKVTQGGTNLNYDIPLCDGCESCKEILNTGMNKCLLCIDSMIMINRSCHTSPMWCPKRINKERVS